MRRVALALTLLVLEAGGATAEHEEGRPPRFVPWPGGPTPALALRDLAGARVSLAEYRGQVVLVNFWATWCEPCQDEMPSFRTLQERLAGRPVTVLAVNYGESVGKVRTFLGRVPVAARVILDPDQDAARAWRVRILPATFLVGPDGRLRYTVPGELDWAAPGPLHAVRSLLP